ncbi:MAG TPA: hypothetical protein VER03_16590 [Bryobacteraceae bacterium]|nr:hypothetical protein [Bryobacteraceae bacterium]
MATLNVKNNSAADVEFETPTGPVKIEANKDKNLGEKELTSKGFAKALDGGSLSFAQVQNPSGDVVELARRILPPLIASMRDRITNQRGRFEAVQKDLLKLRESFNKSWKVAEAQLAASQGSIAGWPAVRNAAKNLLIDTKVEDAEVTQKKQAVTDIEAEIAVLNSEDLAQSGRTLDQWFADRYAKEQALTQAKDELAKVNVQKSDPLATDVASVDGAVTALGALTKAKAIGAEIPEFGK